MLKNTEEILPDQTYPFLYKYDGNIIDLRIKGDELILAIERFRVADLSILEGPQQDH